jgi:hypothetical protein
MDSTTGPLGTLVISTSSVSIPEPSSLILMGSGLLFCLASQHEDPRVATALSLSPPESAVDSSAPCETAPVKKSGDRDCHETGKIFVEIPDAKRFLRIRGERVFNSHKIFITYLRTRAVAQESCGLSLLELKGNGRARTTLKFNRQYLSKDKFRHIVSAGQDSRFRVRGTVPQSRENSSPRFGC